jgi:hypothetical protein
MPPTRTDVASSLLTVAGGDLSVPIGGGCQAAQWFEPSRDYPS